MLKYSEIEKTFNDYGINIKEYNVEDNDEIATPYLVYVANDGDSFGADGINYFKLLNIAVILIDEYMNFELQRKIEHLFDDVGVRFDKNINFDEGQRIYAITYTLLVIDDECDKTEN